MKIKLEKKERGGVIPCHERLCSNTKHDRSVTKYYTFSGKIRRFRIIIVLYGDLLCESIVNKPLSFLSHFYLRTVHVILIQEKKQNTFLYYIRKQLMSVVDNVNRTIRMIEQKKRIYAISSNVFLT